MNFRMPPPDVSEQVKMAQGKGKTAYPSSGSGYSPNEIGRYLYAEWQDRKALSEGDRKNEEDNHRMYTGLDYGQWPKELLEELQCSKDNKDISQFNFVMKKVDGVVGDLVKNALDVEYLSVDGRGSDTLSLYKDLYYTDKELCDWETELITHYTNGTIKESWITMYVDYRHDPKFGNIALQAMTPASVMPDPNWVSNNSGDCKNLFTTTYMKPDAIKRTWPQAAKDVDRYLDTKRLLEVSNESIYNGNSIPMYGLNEDYNEEYRVIQYHWMKVEKQTKKTGLTTSGLIVQVPNDAEDDWFEYNGVDPNNVISEDQNIEKYYITTFIPELNIAKPIESKPGLLQIGRLPFFHWSYNRHNGKAVGMVDLLKDPQMYINRMLGLAHEMLANSKRVKLADPAAFDMSETSQAEVEEKISSGEGVVWTNPDASVEYPQAIQTPGSSEYVGNEVNFANNIMAFTDRLTVQSASMEGIGEERSGIHFEYKREQGEINKTLMREGVRLFWNELAEGYFYAARGLYGGVYREFESQGKVIEINKPQPDGRMLNDITSVTRAKTIITDSPASVSRRINDRVIMNELLQRFGNIDPISASYAMESIYDSMDNVPESRRQAFSADQERKRELLRTNEMAQLSQAQLATIQAQMQKQQIMQPPQQLPPQGAEGGQPPTTDEQVAQQQTEQQPVPIEQ
jgi:hypothetical protein